MRPIICWRREVARVRAAFKLAYRIALFFFVHFAQKFSTLPSQNCAPLQKFLIKMSYLPCFLCKMHKSFQPPSVEKLKTLLKS